MSEIIPFQYPGNAMINFAPLDSALKDYQTGMQVAGESTAKINAANAMKAGDFKGAQAELAKVDPRAALEVGAYPLKQQQLSQEVEKGYRSLIGSHAQTLAEMKDPAERAAALERWTQSEPKVAAGLQRMGIDWKANPDLAIKSIYQDALGAQDPEKQALERAQAAHASVMTAAPGASLVNINPTTPQAAGQTGQVIHQTPLKLNPDYEYIDPSNPQAGVRPRPGGAADTKLLEKQQVARSQLDATHQNLDLLESNVRQLYSPEVKDKEGNIIQPESSHPGLAGNYGIKGQFYNIPGTDAANAWEKLMQLKARGGFDALNAMRQASKTGGALGQVSDAEGKQLQNAFAALGSKQDEKSVKQELTRVLQQIQLSRQRLDTAYQRQFNNPAPTPQGEPAQYPGSQGNMPRSGPAVGNTPKQNTGQLPNTADVNTAYAQARDAIAKGADPNAVRKRLQDVGIDPSGL